MKGIKRIFWLAFLGGFFNLFLVGLALAAPADIVISEIGAYENNSGYEWIEIYNKGSEDVNLAGWYFWEEGLKTYGYPIAATGTNDGIVSPGEYAVIVEDVDKFLSKYPSLGSSIFASDGWKDLVMNGEYIGLKNGKISGDCEISPVFCTESFKYISSTKFSLQRRDPNLNDYTSANWAEHANGNTVGAVNNFFTPSTTPTPPPQGGETTTASPTSPTSQIILESPAQDLSSIKINELVADPQSGNEWVELYNTASTNLDLAGAMICDARNTTSTCKKIIGVIGPNSWFVFDLDTRSFLNNGGDSVILKDSLGAVIDRIDYADELVPDEGQSLARETDGVDTDSENDWIVTNQITAGRANIIDEQDQPDSAATSVSLSVTSSVSELSFPIEVVISEILPNPKGDDSGEFIEIKNNSLVQANLSGWFFRNKEKKYIFPDDTVIFPGSFIVFYKTATKIAIVNTSGKIELFSKDKSAVDLVEYDKPPEGKSYGMVNGEWEWANPTPGKENIGESPDAKQESAGKTSGAKVYKFVNSIEAAREAVKGAWARVRGVVSVLPGVFGSQYFYITDGNTGIQIYQSKKDFLELAVGDRVEINGKVSLANGIKRINIASAAAIDILAAQTVVSTTVLALDEVDESFGGGLVKISGEITEIKSNFMYVDDGNTEAVVYFKKGAKVDKSKFLEGENVEVTGVLEQTKSGWQIWPRGQDDLVSLGLSEDLLKKQALQSNSAGSSEKYLTATAGGFITLVFGFLLRGRGALLKKAGLILVGFIKKNKA